MTVNLRWESLAKEDFFKADYVFWVGYKRVLKGLQKVLYEEQEEVSNVTEPIVEVKVLLKEI